MLEISKLRPEPVDLYAHVMVLLAAHILENVRKTYGNASTTHSTKPTENRRGNHRMLDSLKMQSKLRM